MAGETQLSTLLASMSPQLQPEEYVFCCLQHPDIAHTQLSPIATFRESEGLTVVITKAEAMAHQLPYESIFKCITLTVHSSLDAVGLTAAVATKLAQYDISANVIAAYYHDHIFIQAEKADAAMSALLEFSH